MTTKELNQINRLMNGNVSDLIGAAFLLLAPSLYFKFFRYKFRPITFINYLQSQSGEQTQVSLNDYEFHNPHVINLKQYIDNNLKDECFASLVHGSASTDELINYSDLDAIIILKNEVFHNTKILSRIAYHLFVSRKYMHDLDPLQHHGWLVLPESFLQNFDTAILPISLIEKSKSLTGSKAFEILEKDKISSNKLHSILENLQKRINKKIIPTNMYGLKSMLSEFMLTPSLYLQERYDMNISKKESFLDASKDFSPELYSIMNVASKIRQDWSYKPGPVRSFLLKSLRMLPGGSASFISDRITPDLKNSFDLSFMVRMNNLLECMVSLIDDHRRTK